MAKAKVKTAKKFSLGQLFESPVKWYDVLILLVLMAFMFFCMQMRDLFHTSGCSFGYLNGHILDFYDYLDKVGIAEDGTVGMGAAYLPTVYVIFAIWNIPLKLIGYFDTPTAAIGYIPVMWAKILPCLVYFAGGVVVYSIAKELGMGTKKSKLAAYLYLSMPIAVFSQFGLGQYESFIVLFTLLGVLMWLRKKDVWFVFWFAIAFTFKYTVLIFFIPLLLLRQKNIWKILLSCLGFVALAGIEILIYFKSAGFQKWCFGLGSATEEASPISTILSVEYFTGWFKNNVRYFIYVLVVLFAVLAAWCYFKKTKDDGEEKRYGMYILTLSFACLFALAKWHPHYLMLAVPFWVLTGLMHKDTKIWLILDLLFMFFFSVYNVQFFGTICDETLIQNGLLRIILPTHFVGGGLYMQEIFGMIPKELTLSILTAFIVIYGVFKHPKYMREDMSEMPEKIMGWTRTRTFLGLATFIVPALLCVFVTLNPPKNSYMEDEWGGATIEFSDEQSVVVQPFTANGTEISKLKFRVMTNDDNENALLRVAIVRKDTISLEEISAIPAGLSSNLPDMQSSPEVLYEKEIRMAECYDSERIILSVNAPCKDGEEYAVVFMSENAEGGNVGILTGSTHPELPNCFTNSLNELNTHVAMDIIN